MLKSRLFSYTKHVGIIPIHFSTIFICGNQSDFWIEGFNYTDKEGSHSYPECDVLTKVNEIYDYIFKTVEEILNEIEVQLPNCLDNSRRIQDIKYSIQLKETESGIITDHISFFIEVNNSINELPSEIKVLLLIVKPNDEICSFDFQFDRIFIKLKGGDVPKVIGYAKLKNLTENNELYKTFVIAPCGQEEYSKYVASFKETHPEIIKIKPLAMEGTILIYKD